MCIRDRSTAIKYSSRKKAFKLYSEIKSYDMVSEIVDKDMKRLSKMCIRDRFGAEYIKIS